MDGSIARAGFVIKRGIAKPMSTMSARCGFCRSGVAWVLSAAFALPILALAADSEGDGLSSVPHPEAVKTASGPVHQVRVQAVKDLLVHRRHDAPARVLSLSNSRVASRLSAALVELPVRVGDTVSAGDVLARLDCRRAKAGLARERAQDQVLAAQQRLAVQQLKRAELLLKQRSGAQELVDQRRAELSSTRAQRQLQAQQIALLRADVDDCVLRAPFDGVVLQRLAAVGEVMAPASPVVELLRIDGPEVEALVPTALLLGLRASASAGAAFDLEIDGQTWPLELRAILPSDEALARAVRVRFLFKPGHSARIGATGRLRWQDAQARLPVSVLLRRGAEVGVFVFEDERVRFVALPGAVAGQSAPQGSLAMDAQLVTEGRFSLVNGDRVRVERAAEQGVNGD